MISLPSINQKFKLLSEMNLIVINVKAHPNIHYF